MRTFIGKEYMMNDVDFDRLAREGWSEVEPGHWIIRVREGEGIEPPPSPFVWHTFMLDGKSVLGFRREVNHTNIQLAIPRETSDEIDFTWHCATSQELFDRYYKIPDNNF